MNFFKRLLNFFLDVIIFLLLVTVALFVVVKLLKIRALDIPEEVVTGEYREMSLLDLSYQTYEMVMDIGEYSLNDFNQIYPFIGETIDSLKKSSKAKAILDIDKFKSTNIGDLFKDENYKTYLTLTLNTVSYVFGITLPDVPLITDVSDEFIVDAINSISEKIDINNTTFADLRDNFGIDLLTGDGNLLANMFTYDCKLVELQEVVQVTTLGQILGYAYDEGTEKWLNADSEEAEKIMVPFMDLKLNELSSISTRINSIKLSDIFNETDLQSGPLSLINSNTTLGSMAEEMNRCVTEATMQDLMDAEIFEISSEDKTKLDMIQIVNHCPENKDWNQLTTNEFISWLISVIDLL